MCIRISCGSCIFLGCMQLAWLTSGALTSSAPPVSSPCATANASKGPDSTTGTPPCPPAGPMAPRATALSGGLRAGFGSVAAWIGSNGPRDAGAVATLSNVASIRRPSPLPAAPLSRRHLRRAQTSTAEDHAQIVGEQKHRLMGFATGRAGERAALRSRP